MFEVSVPLKMVDLLRGYYENTLSNVLIYAKLPELLQVAYEFCQGCPADSFKLYYRSDYENRIQRR